MPALLRYAFLAAALSAPPLCAAQAYEDWTVQCDNVKRCEAVGFGRDRDTERWIAFQLMRDAGPGTPVKARFLLSDAGLRKPVVIAMTVDGRPPVRVNANQPIPQDTARGLLATMIDGRSGTASDGRQTWALPLAGMKAALLRMDALQGRIGTPGALVRPGTRPEAAVPPAPAMPVLRAAPRAVRIDDRAMKEAVLAEIGPDEDSDIDYHSLYRLADGRLLFLIEVARGNTSTFHEVWLANARPPYRPRQLELPTNGLPADGLVNANFDGQVLDAYSGRLLYECRHATEWLWTGNGFELLTMYYADNCYGMLGLVENCKWVARRIP